MKIGAHIHTSLFTAVLHKEGSRYVAECPELVTVSQGDTVEAAVANLEEAIGCTSKNSRQKIPVVHSSKSLRRDMPQLPRISGADQFVLLGVSASPKYVSAGATWFSGVLVRRPRSDAWYLCIPNWQPAHFAKQARIAVDDFIAKL